MFFVLTGSDPFVLLLLVLIGIIIGIVSSMVGIGGGLLTVPILIFIFGLNATLASSVSIIVIIFTSSTSALSFLRQKRVDLRTGSIFVALVVPSAFVGGIVSQKIDANLLTIIFGLLMIIVAFRKIYVEVNNKRNGNKTKKSLEKIDKTPDYGLLPERIEQRLIVDKDGDVFRYDLRLRSTIMGSAFGGFIASMLGAGGGIVFVPLLNSIGGVPMHIAVATSSFTIVFSSISGSISRILTGNLPSIVWQYVPFLALGTVSGARFGALKVKKVSSEKILLFFYVIVLISGIRTIAKGLGIF